MNIIDTLVVTLGLDASKFKKGTKEAEKAQDSLSKKTQQAGRKQEEIDKKAAEAQKKRTAEFQKHAKQTAEGFRAIRTQALATIGIFTGGLGITEFVKHTANVGGNLYEMSQTMDMSARKISAYQGALEQLGGSAGEANGMLQQVSQSIGELSNYGTVSSQFSAYQTLSGGKSIQGFKTPEDYIKAASDLINHIRQTSGKSQAYAAAKQLGFSGSAYNLVSHGSAAMTNRVKSNESTSIIQNQKSAKAMQDFRQGIVTLERQFEKIGAQMVTKLMPDLTQFGRSIENAFFKINKLAQKLGGWENINKKGGSYISDAVNASSSAGLAIHDWLFGPSQPKVNKQGRAKLAAALERQGLSPNATTAFLANARRESGYNLHAVGDNGTSGGPFQYHGSRLKQFEAATGKTVKTATWDDWARYAVQDYKTNYSASWARMNSAKTAADAAAEMTRHFEIPKNANKQAAISRSFAKHLSANFSLPRASVHNSNNTSQAHINTINVHTQATDAQGIANSLRPSMFGVIPQIDYGLK